MHASNDRKSCIKALTDQTVARTSQKMTNLAQQRSVFAARLCGQTRVLAIRFDVDRPIVSCFHIVRWFVALATSEARVDTVTLGKGPVGSGPYMLPAYEAQDVLVQPLRMSLHVSTRQQTTVAPISRR